jgi:chemotaxis protein MotB
MVVLRQLASEGVAAEHLSAAGYGEFRPVASNAAEDGRKQNRRVDLVVAVSVPVDEHP